MKDRGSDENDWDLIVNTCIKELSDNHGYDKVYRFGPKKN